MFKKILIIALFAAVASGCGRAGQEQSENNPANNNSNSVPIVVQDSAVIDAYSIRLTSPQPGQVLKSPFLVGGEANVPDDVVYVRIKNQSGDVVISEQTRIKHEQGEAGPFGVLLSFVFQATDHGVVEVYAIDPSTGAEVALESVEVNFDVSSSGNTTVQ